MKDAKSTHIGLLILRVALGVMLLYFGSQKVAPVFGSPGYAAMMDGLQKSTGAPSWLVLCAILAETAGALGVIVGLLTRVAAFGILCAMSMAAYTQIQSADLMQPQTMSSVFVPMAFGAMALALMLTGAGSLSIDQKLADKMDKASKPKER